MSGVTLTVVFRHSGWRWPLRVGDGVQVWDGDRLVAEFPGEFVLEVLRHHLLGLSLQHRGAALVTEVKPMLPSLSDGRPRLRAPSSRRLRGRP